MKQNINIETIKDIMQQFANLTGLEPSLKQPKRYLWTDAFAVCNYLELCCLTKDHSYLELASKLVEQVHHTLGRHREDDTRTGWISGLTEYEGKLHPTKGGLRIGKPLNERQPGEPYDERLEWDQDGQYYHYLTKWMHALNRMGRVTEDSIYVRWALELAQTAHAGFVDSTVGRKRMYWKMSIDLSHPLVPSMGQHDPLDGFITYNELQVTANDFKKKSPDLNLPNLKAEIEDMTNICREMNWATNDPLGIGGLLSDALRIGQLIKYGLPYERLLEDVMDSALFGLESFAEYNPQDLSAEYRLAFRELGLSIGIKGIKNLKALIKSNKGLFSQYESINQIIESLMNYLAFAVSIEEFWMDKRNQKVKPWIEHKEINMVMLATSLAPEEFLKI